MRQGVSDFLSNVSSRLAFPGSNTDQHRVIHARRVRQAPQRARGVIDSIVHGGGGLLHDTNMVTGTGGVKNGVAMPSISFR